MRKRDALARLFAQMWLFCTVECSDYSTGPPPMTMDSATQSVENCSVGLSAHFHRHAAAKPPSD
ncbi:hypothetical protein BDI4_590017 [Burkholderia diffusa]|nr:hypothetical protein BDI4_590017 [Burkholderia diffusa]